MADTHPIGCICDASPFCSAEAVAIIEASQGAAPVTTTSTVDMETVNRQIRVAKLVITAHALGVAHHEIADQEHIRNALVDYMQETEPTFREPSSETWRLVVAHLSVVEACKP